MHLNGNGLSVTFLGFSNHWHSTDQIPQRAVDAGLIGRFGFIEETDGGETYRYSGAFDWQQSDVNDSTRLTAYTQRYGVQLFHNFTYFLNDPVNGDQFEQLDVPFRIRRNVVIPPGTYHNFEWEFRYNTNRGALYRHTPGEGIELVARTGEPESTCVPRQSPLRIHTFATSRDVVPGQGSLGTARAIVAPRAAS